MLRTLRASLLNIFHACKYTRSAAGIDILRSYTQCNILSSCIQKKDTSQSFSRAHFPPPPSLNNIYTIIFLTGSPTYTTHSFTDENCGGDIKVVKAYGKCPV